MDRAFDACWGLEDPVAIPLATVPLDGLPPHPGDRAMGPAGLPLRWATAVHFRRSREAERFFEQARIVRDHWDVFAMTYGFPRAPYRSDFAFTVAAHAMDGGARAGALVPPLPGPGLVTACDRDDLIACPGPGRLLFLLNDRTEPWCNRLCATEGLSVHVQNKFGVVRCADALLAHHGGVA